MGYASATGTERRFAVDFIVFESNGEWVREGTTACWVREGYSTEADIPRMIQIKYAPLGMKTEILILRKTEIPAED